MIMHILTIEKKYFGLIRCGCKKADLRYDKDFKAGECIHYVDDNGDEFPGHELNLYRITNVLRDVPEYGLYENFVILSIERIC